MSEPSISLENVQRRAIRAAIARGHEPGPFEAAVAASSSGPQVPARRARCTRCGSEIWALSNGETSVGRLCRRMSI